jgi:hypothetical protein
MTVSQIVTYLSKSNRMYVIVPFGKAFKITPPSECFAAKKANVFAKSQSPLQNSAKSGTLLPNK